MAGSQILQEIGEVSLVRRAEQRLRRAADAEPGEGRERLVGGEAAAQVRHLGREHAGHVGEMNSHAKTPSSQARNICLPAAAV